MTPAPTGYRRLRSKQPNPERHAFDTIGFVTLSMPIFFQNASIIGAFSAVANWKLRFARLLPWDWSAVIPGTLDSSRVTRELQATLFSVDWGMKGVKPRRLQLWSHASSGLPLSLEAGI